MLLTAIFVVIILRFPYIINGSRACRPNTQILVNGKVCSCNKEGEWSEANCKAIERRHICKPGQVIFQGCSTCVCQENGQLSCTDDTCSQIPHYQNVHEMLNVVLPWCNPYRTYYISCNICVCPASGKTADAHCAIDISCTIFKEPSTTEISLKRNTCIPKIMYLFPCLHCLCSDEGYFILSKCVETCVKKQVADMSRRCIPKTLYRKDCNVCRCPDNSFPEDKLCTNNSCHEHLPLKYLRTIKSQSYKCIPHKFTQPKCVYCDCLSNGTIDETACLELMCLNNNELKYDVPRQSCSPGEMVPICMECFCTRSGITIDGYCSQACFHLSKVKVLEKIVSQGKLDLIIDKDAIRKHNGLETCDPNSIYIDQGRYCLCSEAGNTNFNLCTAVVEPFVEKLHKIENKIVIDFNATCEPSTFVDFDCNVCFCSKKGKIDPKWCTYDDCEAKRIIQEAHKNDHISPAAEAVQLSTTCNPGSISKVECNYCICPETGNSQNKVCTKNDCSTFVKTPVIDQFSCEPAAYYEVDCNICFCPRDGLKNVAKCTKNHCEKSFLRTDVCAPGQLFSDECNVCVCPPNGFKGESACTNYTCTAPWKKIFQLSETLLGNQITEDATRMLDLCFPGEEFILGCYLCVCPDMGLRTYATCSPTFCDEDSHTDRNIPDIIGSNRGITLRRKYETRREYCEVVNSTRSKDKCHPGSMYIMRCKECICPYMGRIPYFCRPLPKDFYCEEAFPGVNYLPMSNLAKRTNLDVSNTTSAMKLPTNVIHEHTRYECDQPGKIMDECFICECANNTVIAEHCFRSEEPHCKSVSPSFLNDSEL